MRLNSMLFYMVTIQLIEIFFFKIPVSFNIESQEMERKINDKNNSIV